MIKTTEQLKRDTNYKNVYCKNNEKMTNALCTRFKIAFYM